MIMMKVIGNKQDSLFENDNKIEAKDENLATLYKQ